ncbi:phosphorylase family protein [Legionella sp. CNM-4043-24]|uniref:phosphorylase family protein n=1 Tax=Legionella sp. CNM-4043-24 TaxID=3421646 RepID=UPI00403B1509
MNSTSQAHHINALPEDMQGNGSIGRYWFLTGSDERARLISERFQQVRVNKHPRQHNIYLGTLPGPDGELIDVASVSLGMGGPSADIIINELLLLGARRLLRVGTAASLQAPRIKTGDLVIASAAVRDDKASWDYIYREYPAVASLDYLGAIQQSLQEKKSAHIGIVHSKSSLFAREFDYSLVDEHHQYMRSMTAAGVLATEMECAQLFILASLASARNPEKGVSAGAVLAIIGDNLTPFSEDKSLIENTINNAIELSLASTLRLAKTERQ